MGVEEQAGGRGGGRGGSRWQGWWKTRGRVVEGWWKAWAKRRWRRGYQTGSVLVTTRSVTPDIVLLAHERSTGPLMTPTMTSSSRRRPLVVAASRRWRSLRRRRRAQTVNGIQAAWSAQPVVFGVVTRTRARTVGAIRRPARGGNNKTFTVALNEAHTALPALCSAPTASASSSTTSTSTRRIRRCGETGWRHASVAPTSARWRGHAGNPVYAGILSARADGGSSPTRSS